MKLDWNLILVALITALSTLSASSGVWLYMDKKRSSRNAMERLLIGLAHDRIICLSLLYIDRGYITPDEFENLHEFLFVPYKELGGNGSAVRLMEKVKGLPLHNHLLKVDGSNVLAERKEKS